MLPTKHGPTEKARTVLQGKGHVAESKEERVFRQFSPDGKNKKAI